MVVRPGNPTEIPGDRDENRNRRDHGNLLSGPSFPGGGARQDADLGSIFKAGPHRVL